ncbi:MAG: fructose PTS transporter subunit IIB [Mycoplasma sp.]|nr:fructose PTS transporter subunit IIB [Mycoplasma sp.]
MIDKKTIKEKIKIIDKWNKEHLKLKQEDHTYRVDGNITISVTHFIKPFFSDFDEKMKLEWFRKIITPARIRGTEVHKWTEEFDKNNKLKPIGKYSSYCKNYIQFINDNSNMEILASEFSLYSKSLNICGTIDRLFWDKEKNKLYLLDIKTGSKMDIHWYQQLTYEYILNEWGIDVDDLMLLSLKGNSYSLSNFKSKDESKNQKKKNEINKHIKKRIEKVEAGEDGLTFAKKIVAITSCSTGIALTYLAAEKLESTAKELGYKIKVETHGSTVDNKLSEKDINNADFVIIATHDNAKHKKRFTNKNIILSRPEAVLKNPKYFFDAKNFKKQKKGFLFFKK